MKISKKLSPVGKRILVKKLSESNEMIGGILIPDSVKQDTNHAEVIDLGTYNDFSVSIGETVILNKHAGIPVEFGGEKYVLVIEEDILAIICD